MRSGSWSWIASEAGTALATLAVRAPIGIFRSVFVTLGAMSFRGRLLARLVIHAWSERARISTTTLGHVTSSRLPGACLAAANQIAARKVPQRVFRRKRVVVLTHIRATVVAVPPVAPVHREIFGVGNELQVSGVDTLSVWALASAQAGARIVTGVIRAFSRWRRTDESSIEAQMGSSVTKLPVTVFARSASPYPTSGLLDDDQIPGGLSKTLIPVVNFGDDQ